jgi:hypothetical protein
VSTSLRFVVVLIGVLGLLLPNTTAALAGTQGNCNESDLDTVQLFENVKGVTSDNDDRLWKCSNDSSLANDDHTLPGTCAGFGGQPTWNDCVSSYMVFIPSGTLVCFYRDINYGVILDHRGGPPERFDILGNDQLSSLKFLAALCPI